VRIGTLDFNPGPWPTIGAAAMLALTLWLGHWQTGRGDEKEAMQQLLEARVREPVVDLSAPIASADDILYRRVRAKGEWITGAQFFIDNRVLEGRAGFHVIAPLRIAGLKQALLVDRGWIERGPEYPKAPRVELPGGEVQVAGMATLPPKRFLELSSDVIDGDVWQNLSIERYGSVTGRAVLPFVLVADYAPAPLAAVHERPDTGVDRHREYALTWYSLSVLTLVLWVALNARRAR